VTKLGKISAANSAWGRGPKRHIKLILFGIGFDRLREAMKHAINSRWCLVLVCLLASACARPFVAKTPTGFVELERQNTAGYDYRATHPDGLVTSVRVVANEPRGSLSFWSRAIENQMRETHGYSLLGRRTATSVDGTLGEQLQFGHDEGQKPHLYLLTLFADQDDIFILEQGGDKNLVEQHRSELNAAISGFSIRSGLARFFSYRGHSY